MTFEMRWLCKSFSDNRVFFTSFCLIFRSLVPWSFACFILANGYGYGYGYLKYINVKSTWLVLFSVAILLEVVTMIR